MTQQSTSQDVFGATNQVFSQIGQVNPTVEAGQSAGEAVGAVISTIGGISDAAKRSQFKADFNSLSLQDQEKIGNDILKANDQVSKLNILINAMLVAKINGSNKGYQDKKNIVIILDIIIFVTIILTGIKKSLSSNKLKTL